MSNVPKRRFAGFSRDWEEKPLETVAKYENGKAHEKEIDETGDYVVVNSKFISTNGEVKKFTKSAICIAKKDDILMVLSDVPNGRAIAKCFFVDTDNLYTVNQRICKLTPNKAVSVLLFYSLNRSPYFLAFDDGVKQTNLRKDDVLNCPILLPPDLKEQQKIANCLSSIDTLITAQTQKLDTLKAHKKGLMQQLFPATGETIPKRRFPEFRYAGDWEEKPLGEVVKFLDGKRKPIKESDRASMQGRHPYYGASGIIDYVNNFIFDEDLILLGEDGENIVSRNLPLVFKVSGKYWVNNHAHVLKPKKPHSLEFLVQYMETLSYIKYNSGGAQPKLNQAVCKTIPLILPLLPEQQKIANCLTSIDDLITAQTQKIESLKAHKKGLMQQLFPASEEMA